LSVRRWAFVLAAVLGIVAGVGIAAVWFWPPGPLQLRFVGSGPVSTIERDGHRIRVYLVHGELQDVERAASAELTAAQGWQPPTLRSVVPRLVQITRVRSPRGDFQFVRVLLEQDGPDRVRVTLDEGPTQTNAFR
jgi:hypothetical protein